MVCCYVGFYPFYLCWYLPITSKMRKLVYEFRKKKLYWLYGITYHIQLVALMSMQNQNNIMHYNTKETYELISN